MKVLLDTNVVSELVRPRPEPRVAKFVSELADPVLSVITLHELHFGAERAGDPLRRAKLRAWIESLSARFSGRLIEVTAGIAAESGRMRAGAALLGIVVEPLDALIAASAQSCAADIATRNTADFAPLGVSTIDPWKT